MALGTAMAIGGGAALGGLGNLLSGPGELVLGASSPSGQLGAEISHGSLANLKSLFSDASTSQLYNQGIDAQQRYGQELYRLSQNGGLIPTQGDISTSNQFAQNIFSARRQGLTNLFSDQLTEANRQAAAAGRDINDPILKARLLQEQSRQRGMLDAEQQSFASQYALNLPGQRLSLLGGSAQALGGLGQSAISNRFALLNAGNQIYQADRQFQLSTAERQKTFGNKLGDFFSGAVAGAGTGASLAGSFAGLGGAGGFGGGGGGSLPAFQQLQQPNFGYGRTGSAPSLGTNFQFSPISLGGYG